MRQLLFALFVLFCFAPNACSAQQPTAQIHLDNGKVVLLLDARDAGSAVTHDKQDGFFEKVTVGEMSIQMKKVLEPTQDNSNILSEYISFLKSDMMDFNADELKFMTAIIQKMYATVSAVNTDILPDTLKIIKTQGRHYGDGVWYTRENCIIVPAGELRSQQENSFLSTMYHELFHVYSRLNPEKSAKLYKLVGFESLGYANLQLPEALQSLVLHNPDGVDFAQKISLTQEDKSTIDAVPIIYANNQGFKTEKDEFFAYLEFNIYEIKKTDNGKWAVQVKEDGFSSTLSLQTQPDFFRQIKDNTGYIIHPDEVLADNFSFIMQGRDGSKVGDKFSPAGKELLKAVEAVLVEK